MSSSEVNYKEQATAKRVDYLLVLLRRGLTQIIRPGETRGRIDYLLHQQKLELAELFMLRPDIILEREYEALAAMAREHGIPFEPANADELQAYQDRHREQEQAFIEQEQALIEQTRIEREQAHREREWQRASSAYMNGGRVLPQAKEQPQRVGRRYFDDGQWFTEGRFVRE